eukprot:CAMPEP_0116143150 /NCGR_PEP_ID=MMETSP0329-20121206/15294_1 /TAXON_ID=697910 /ORGANISM="Pseudo-nitzschia arenysensis, Strain B593" /LENGTH=304 /DNA_ID=CAMNT_0003638445 /DNA_START=359 /DNA_END=1273 /DNA_ORIENTATION=+
MTMNHFLPHTFSPIRTVVEEGSTEAAPTAKPSTIPNTNPRPIGLASRGSEDSMSSWASSETDSVVSAGRRQIFSEYRKTNTPAIPNGIQDDVEEAEENEDKQPRSPLLQHYPSARATKQVGSIHSGSPTSTIHLNMKKNNSTKLSPRRSIFGNARSNSYNSYSTDNNIDLDRFFSKHEHMTVLSSSLDSDAGLAASTTTTASTLLLARRPRSYSCSDASVAAARSILRKGPLTSCLKRRNSHNSCNDSIIADVASNNSIGGEAPERRPSVTFDSQIEIVAFAPTSSFDEEPSCLNGSWTNLFEH